MEGEKQVMAVPASREQLQQRIIPVSQQDEAAAAALCVCTSAGTPRALSQWDGLFQAGLHQIQAAEPRARQGRRCSVSSAQQSWQLTRIKEK